MELDGQGLSELYGDRFGGRERQRTGTWRILVSRFFQRWVPKDSVVLDLAAGHCEFINHIEAGRRIAVDLNPEVKTRATAGVESLILRSDELTPIDDGSIDRVFVSNFFEHIDRETILSTLREVRRVLRPDGRLLILQPNVRFAARDYWMFFDHITPVDDRALGEALRQTGFSVELNIPRFLPYTMSGNLPTADWLVKAYLKLPLAWRFLGAQTFMVAKPAAD